MNFSVVMDGGKRALCSLLLPEREESLLARAGLMLREDLPREARTSFVLVAGESVKNEFTCWGTDRKVMKLKPRERTEREEG